MKGKGRRDGTFCPRLAPTVQQQTIRIMEVIWLGRVAEHPGW